MPHIQIRDVSDAVHGTLVQRAGLAGQSLQQYLAAQLTLLAETPTLEEVLDRIEKRRGGRMSGRETISAIAAERARR